jgi:hypothetical protein
MRLLSLSILAAITLLPAACSKEDGYTDQQRLCIAQQFPKYDNKNFDQCISVCKGCLSGNTVTCSTSCTLKGAS